MVEEVGGGVCVFVGWSGGRRGGRGYGGEKGSKMVVWSLWRGGVIRLLLAGLHFWILQI